MTEKEYLQILKAKLNIKEIIIDQVRSFYSLGIYMEISPLIRKFLLDIHFQRKVIDLILNSPELANDILIKSTYVKDVSKTIWLTFVRCVIIILLLW